MTTDPSPQRIKEYSEFWLYYLREHSRPATRALHFFGTILAILCLAFAALLGNLWFLVAAPICGYGPSWISHFFVEHNRPATFSYPLWSLVSDFRMFGYWITGKLDNELKKAQDQGRKSDVDRKTDR